jgi:hypothetical protein
MGKCESCWDDIDHTSIVEWLALSNGVNLVSSIRVVHKNCCYYNTQFEELELQNLYDRWLPLAELEELIPMALDMPWDNVFDAELELIDILHRTKEEVQHG